MAQNRKKPETKGWGGREDYPHPVGPAYIECEEMKCVGCGICMMACAMKHWGVLNTDLARMQVRKYLLPLPKAVQVTCVQCPDQERECEKACPVDPPAIYFDKNSLHMVIDGDRCLGEKCMICQGACSAKAIRIYPSVSPTPFVCDLCDTENNGNTDPQCVDVCPEQALYFKRAAHHHYPFQDMERMHPDEKAELIAKRMYPLTKECMGYPGWR